MLDRNTPLESSKMPGKEIIMSAEIPGSPNLFLLKSHKALPKRRIVHEAAPAPIATPHRHVYDLDREGYSSSERIRSWIPEPSGAEVIPDPSLPLTPPLNGSEAQSGISNTTHIHNDSTHPMSSGITTPVIQRSPPTPETTPPKIDEHYNTSGSSDPYLSSARTGSFETALEDQISHDDTVQSESPSLRPSRQTWLRNAGHTVHETIGLGLGLEQEDGEETPTGTVAQAASGHEDLISFEGAWNGATPEMSAVKGGADLTYRSGLKQHRSKKSRISEQSLKTPLIVDRSTPSSATRSASSTHKTDSTKHNAPHRPRAKHTEKIRWPLQDDHTTSDEQSAEADDRRFSQVSTTSTIVEAMVFNTPPQRKKTLRHSSGFADLNSAATQAKRSSSNPHQYDGRRLVRHSKSPNGGQRSSFVSSLRSQEDSKTSRRKQATVPVIMILERDPYSCLIFLDFPHLRRLKVLTHALIQSSRPTTAPQDPVGYFDVPQTERRIASAYVPVSPLKEDRKAENDTQVAKSPLSTPPSSHLLNNISISRATSNASGPVESIGPSTRQQSQSGHHSSGFPNNEILSPDEESNADWSALRPHSSIVTPFSLRSARSSTPGTLEINEATAISIYPHTNKSILVVQHAARRDSKQPPEHSAIIASNAKFAIPAGSVQPPVIHQPRQLLDSPLQNPRSPPQPPDFKIIPPTPANVTDNNTSPDRQRGTSPSEYNPPPARRLSTRVRRAFSIHRYSDIFAAVPLKRTLSLSSPSSRRNTIAGNHHRRASTGLDPDRNLHPFWRPRAFWDGNKDDGEGGSDSDSDFGNDGFLVGNSLGMPSEGVKMFDPPTTATKRRGNLSRRFGSLRFSGRRSSAPSHHRLPYQSDGMMYGEYDDERAPAVRRFSTTRASGGFSGLVGRRNRDGNASYEFIQRPMREEQQQGVGVGVVPRLGYQ
ncbi:MAG: hypothetical protein Q9222_005546, partial [Ikaeria aurantiellina]